MSDPFYRLEHQEVDLKKKKEAEPVLVRLQRMTDSRHSDDYALNKALRARLRVSDILFCLLFHVFVKEKALLLIYFCFFFFCLLESK